MTPREITDIIRSEKVGVLSISIEDASKYVANARGEMQWAGTLFTKKSANRQEGDEVIETGNKETNITEVERTLKALVGKGVVWIRLFDRTIVCEMEQEEEEAQNEPSILERTASAVLNARKAQGITISQLSHKTGINPSNLSRIERGEVYPNLQTLASICDALGLTIEIK